MNKVIAAKIRFIIQSLGKPYRCPVGYKKGYDTCVTASTILP